MPTIALDINGRGVAVQSYQDKVQQLTDVIGRHLARFRRIALLLLGNIADAEDAVPDAFVSAFTPGSVQRTSEHVHVAHGHRDQCRSHEVASTFTASANFFRRNPRRAKPSARRDAARPPTKPRRGMLQAGTCRKTRRRDNTTLAYLG